MFTLLRTHLITLVILLGSFPRKAILFPCAPQGLTPGMKYDDWSDLQKLQFGVCYESNDTLIEDLIKRTTQMPQGTECSELDPTWEKVRPGINNVDYFDEFHMEIHIPKDLLMQYNPPLAEYPKNARVLTERGFNHVFKLLTTNDSVCDTMSNKHMPMECREGFCECKIFRPSFGNDYSVHYTEFRDRKKVPIPLHYNVVTKNCTFPLNNECKVQPNEDHPEGYHIPCFEMEDKCLIRGNKFPCNRVNVMKTMELYNIKAHEAKDRHVPFRLHFPIPCTCSNATPRTEDDGWPSAGYEHRYIRVQDYDEDDDHLHRNYAYAFRTYSLVTVVACLLGTYIH